MHQHVRRQTFVTGFTSACARASKLAVHASYASPHARAGLVVVAWDLRWLFGLATAKEFLACP